MTERQQCAAATALAGFQKVSRTNEPATFFCCFEYPMFQRQDTYEQS